MIEKCLTGAVLICVICLFRMIAGRRVPKRIICVLWIVAAGFFLFSFRIPSVFNLYNISGLLPKERVAQQTVTRIVTDVSVQSTARATMPAVGSKGTDGGSLLSVIYIVGCCLLGVWMLLSYAVGLLRFHSGRPESTPFIKKWSVQHPLRRPLKILVSDRIAVPVSGGLLFPVILLPADRGTCTDRELECILTHEYQHICHFDALWKLLFSACLCLFWFHPAVWVMVLLAERDIEYACDESVLATGICPRDYGSALIRMELRRSDRPALTNSFVAGRLLSRVDRIKVHRGRKPLSWIVEALLAVVLLAVFATGPVRGEEGAGSTSEAPQIVVPIPTYQNRVNASWHEAEGVGASALLQPTVQMQPDPYGNYLFLGEMTGVSFNDVETAVASLKAQYSPHLLRITCDEELLGNDLNKGAFYHIQVYDFPQP